MSSKCSKVATPRWLSLGNVIRWFERNPAIGIVYLDEKTADYKPTVSWWISLLALSTLFARVDIMPKYLQYAGLLVTHQREAIELFIVHLREKFWLRSPLSSLQNAGLRDASELCKEAFSVLLSDVPNLVNGLGSSVFAMFKGLAEYERI